MIDEKLIEKITYLDWFFTYDNGLSDKHAVEAWQDLKDFLAKIDNKETKEYLIMDEDLLPCPFCGEHGIMFEDYRYKNGPKDMWYVFGVQCSSSDCIMHQQQKFYMTEYDARRAWNRREKN